MKVGIMQPYFFPYLGYWQLINAVDKFVIYDDVNFINRGWINRNCIYVNNNLKYINVHLNAASQNKKINQIEVLSEKTKSNIQLIKKEYVKAPYFEIVFPLLQKILMNEEKNLTDFLAFSIIVLCEYMGIKTDILLSSELKKNNTLKGQDKIIDICKLLGATQYYNAIGGKKLYNEKDFINNGIELSFLEMNKMYYKHYEENVETNLSIIDVLMFNRRERVKEMLCNFNMVSGCSEEFT